MFTGVVGSNPPPPPCYKIGHNVPAVSLYSCSYDSWVRSIWEIGLGNYRFLFPYYTVTLLCQLVDMIGTH